MRASVLFGLVLLRAVASGQGRDRQADDHYMELLTRVQASDHDQAMTLLKAGVNPNPGMKALLGVQIPLIYAARLGDKELVEALLSAGANPNFQDDSGKSALFYAVDRGFVSIARALLAAGANPNGSPSHGCVAAAISGGFPDILELLLSRNADPDFISNGESPLVTAAREGRTDAVKLLFRHGGKADLTPNNRTMPSALVTAVQLGHAEIVRALLDAGADIGAVSPADTVLRYAVGTRVAGTDLTAHGLAIETGHPEIADLIANAAMRRGGAPPPFPETATSIGRDLRVLSHRLFDRGIDANRIAGRAIDNLEFFAQKWQPSPTPARGRASGWPASMQFLQAGLESAAEATDTNAVVRLLRIAEADLRAKAEHCRLDSNGTLGNPVKVSINTRRGEAVVNNLAVCWKPAIFEARKGACTGDFLSPSSPAVAEMVPGVYLITVRDPLSKNQNARPFELEVGQGKQEVTATILLEW